MSKLTIDECKRIIMQGKKQLTAAEKRIAELEQLVRDLWCAYAFETLNYESAQKLDLERRMRELGIKVGE